MDKSLLEILVCPVTKGPLVFDRERQELLSRGARLAYPVRDGIPVIINLSQMSDADARRLIDFASGVCYAVNGKMEQVAKGVYLLKPAGRSGHEVPEYGD